jgi:hypothetical protein
MKSKRVLIVTLIERILSDYFNQLLIFSNYMSQTNGSYSVIFVILLEDTLPPSRG